MVSKMSMYTRFKTPFSILKKGIIPPVWLRTLAADTAAFNTAAEASDGVIETENPKVDNYRKKKFHPPEKCIEYMKSKAYQMTYGDKPVWHVYIRNFKGNLPPQTRLSCYFGSYLSTSSPCPICRDQYLLADYRNVELLKQFISPYAGEIISTKVTGVCQKQHKALVVAIKKARNYGLLSFPVPHRVYNYSLYNKK